MTSARNTTLTLSMVLVLSGACARPVAPPPASLDGTLTTAVPLPDQKTAASPAEARTPEWPVHPAWAGVALEEPVLRGAAWLVASQGDDGGWGQDGGHSGDARREFNLESTDNDVANTSIAGLALLRSGSTPAAGKYAASLGRAVGFVLARVEKSPEEGLAVTDKTGTQIQRKLGASVDTFLAAMLLGQVDGHMADEASSKRVHAALEKCLKKIAKNQSKDGSWNADGWAPIVATSLASRSLQMASDRGVDLAEVTVALDRVQEYSVRNANAAVAAAPLATPGTASPTGGTAIGVGRTYYGVGGGADVAAASAGVSLYAVAQNFEQLNRSPESRAANSGALAMATESLSDDAMLSGFGSMGGEEFVSYLNLSDALVRSGGEPWRAWNSKIRARLVDLQNKDGTWSGHHCITGRVACTAAAVMTLLAERTIPKSE